MEKEVISIIEKLNFTNYTVRKVSLNTKNTWEINLEYRKFILKINNKNKRRKSKKHFYNELTIYEYLSEAGFKNIPRVISTDNKNYILLEYISSNKFRNIDNKNFFIDLLLEFNYFNIKKIKKRSIIRDLFDSFILTFYSLLHGNKLCDSLKTLILLIKLNLEIKKEKVNYLIHNDLYGFNNLLLDNERIVIIDFETTFCTSRLRFKDIIESSINKDNAKINYDLINNYLSRSMNKIDVNNFYNQFRYIIILKMLKNLYRTKNENTIKNKYEWKKLYYKMLNKKEFNTIKKKFVIDTGFKRFKK